MHSCACSVFVLRIMMNPSRAQLETFEGNATAVTLLQPKRKEEFT